MKAIQTRRVLGVVLVEDDEHCHPTCGGIEYATIGKRAGVPCCKRAFNHHDTKTLSSPMKIDTVGVIRCERCLAAEKAAKAMKGAK